MISHYPYTPLEVAERISVVLPRITKTLQGLCTQFCLSENSKLNNVEDKASIFTAFLVSQIVLTLGGTEEGRALYSFGMIVVVEESWESARRREQRLLRLRN